MSQITVTEQDRRDAIESIRNAGFTKKEAEARVRRMAPREILEFAKMQRKAWIYSFYND